MSSSTWAGEAKGEGRKGKKAKEEKVTLDQVPAAVKATILKEAGKNKIKEIEKVTQGKKVFFEAEWTAGHKTIEIKVAPDGRLLKKEVEKAEDEKEEKEAEHKKGKEKDEEEEEEEEEEHEVKVTLDQVPAAVKATILKEAGKNKIKEIEKVTQGKMVFFEAEWTAGHKTIEIKVSPKGKLLDKKVEKDDDEDHKGKDKDDDDDDDDDEKDKD